MGNPTPGEMWTWLLAAASAIVLLWNAAKALSGAWQAAKAPNEEQNKRIKELEDWKKEIDQRLPKDFAEWQRGVDRKLANDYEALQIIKDGLRASYQAQLALLDHGIDGNNIKQMEDAKAVLHNHLANK